MIPYLPDIRAIIGADGQPLYPITTQILNFVVTAFNGLMNVSNVILEKINEPVIETNIFTSYSPLEMMLGVGVPVFITLVVVKWIGDFIN